jgi:hypothetical protein
MDCVTTGVPRPSLAFEHAHGKRVHAANQGTRPLDLTPPAWLVSQLLAHDIFLRQPFGFLGHPRAQQPQSYPTFCG